MFISSLFSKTADQLIKEIGILHKRIVFATCVTKAHPKYETNFECDTNFHFHCRFLAFHTTNNLH